MKATRGARIILGLAAVVVLAGCPLPFEFTPSVTTGAAVASRDPANPLVTSPTTLTIVQTSTGTTVDASAPSIISNRNIAITLDSETRGASIFYTLDDTPPTPGQGSTQQFDQSEPIVLNTHDQTIVVQAIAIGPSMYPSVVTSRDVSVVYDTVAQPLFEPAPGNYTADQSVSISTSTPDATIYYTIVDGASGAPLPQPGQAGTLEYSGPISITGSGTARSISAVAAKAEMVTSAPSAAVYTIGFDPATPPSASPTSGTYQSDQLITLTTSEQEATIYYTIGYGNDLPEDPIPGSAGTVEYSEPIAVPGDGTTATVAALTRVALKLDSTVVRTTITIEYPSAAPPVISPSSGLFNSDSIDITLSSATPSATIWYTIDGSEPVPSGPFSLSLPSGQEITLAATTTVRAIAVGPGYSPSAISEATFTRSAFAAMTRTEIAQLDPQMSDVSVDNSDGNRIPVDAIIAYVTGQGAYGKMLVTVSDASNNNGLTFDHVTYAADGTVHASGTGTVVTGTWGFDLDLQGAEQGDGQLDFRLRNQSDAERSFNPAGGARFYFLP